MDALILNAGHSQLEEQLKIAAACGVAERQHEPEIGDITAVIAEDTSEEMITANDNTEGIVDNSMTSSSSDHGSSADSPPPPKQALLDEDFVKTLQQLSKQQNSRVVNGTEQGITPAHGNFRTELKRPDLKGTFRCSICQKIFCHSSSLSRHRMQAHFKSYTCTLCRKEITSNETLRAHMYKQHQISRMFMCRCCNWAFPDKTSLHMHMQAKEEGKTISVPVIGKGNPPANSQQNQNQNQQQQHRHRNENLTSQINIPENERNSTQSSTLHAPQPRVPTANPFTPLQLHSLVGLAPQQQPISLSEQNSLQAAAATLFPQMALLRGASGSGSHIDDLMSKLRERLMLNNLVAQSNFGLAAWLSAYPKMDQSNATEGNALEICSPKESDVGIIPEEDEINVDKEYDDDIMVERNGVDHHQSHIVELNGKNVSMKKTAAIMISRGNVSNNDSGRNSERSKSAHEFEDEKRDLQESTLRPASNVAVGIISAKTMPNLRSAISSSLKNNLLSKTGCFDDSKSHFNNNLNGNGNDNGNSNNNNNNNNNNRGDQGVVGSELSDNAESHVSPSETHSSTSNGTSPPASRECYDCAVYKGKLAIAENRCRYLEGKTATLQSDAIRFSTRVTVTENSARQYEQEGRLLREQNEMLQRKLLECQEKTLAFMQGDQASNAQAVAFYLNDILKTTFLR